MLIFYTFCTQTEQNTPYNQQQPIQITINAQTQSGLEQDNDAQQQAKHTSLQSAIIETNIGNDENKEKFLKPYESASRYTIRNAIKIMAVYIVAKTYPPAGLAYLANRLIIQPLLNNGDIFETISEKEEQEYAKQGLKKTPDLIVFPVAHRIKKYLIK
jgi:hypothetical protein